MRLHSAADYLAMLQGLLPRGAAWRREPGAILTRFLAAAAEELTRLDSAAWRLLDEANPRTTLEALEDWERVLGLPDACGIGSGSLTERRYQVLRKLVRPVGQDIPFFEALAKAMGYPAVVREFRPFAADVSGADDYVNDAPGGSIVDASAVPATVTTSDYDGWYFVFRMEAPEERIIWFSADVSGAEEPLASWGNSLYECVINRAKPAHTVAAFGYRIQEE